MQTLGKKQFWAFYQDLDKTNWKEKVPQYFGKDVATVDQEFKTFVQTIPDPPEAFKYKFSKATAHLHY